MIKQTIHKCNITEWKCSKY